MSDVRTVRLEIYGRVQGVFFRVNARDSARELNLRGWVRNRRDGSVEALATGTDLAVERFVAWCRRGPAAARVDRVMVEPADTTADDDDFEIRR